MSNGKSLFGFDSMEEVDDAGASSDIAGEGSLEAAVDNLIASTGDTGDAGDAYGADPSDPEVQDIDSLIAEADEAGAGDGFGRYGADAVAAPSSGLEHAPLQLEPVVQTAGGAEGSKGRINLAKAIFADNMSSIQSKVDPYLVGGWLAGYNPAGESDQILTSLTKATYFDSWQTLSPDQKITVLDNAIGCAMSGMGQVDAASQAYQSIENDWNNKGLGDGIVSKIKNAGLQVFGVAKAAIEDDFLPLLEALVPTSEKQLINRTAITLWVGHRTNYTVPAGMPGIGGFKSDRYGAIIKTLDDLWAKGMFRPIPGAPGATAAPSSAPAPSDDSSAPTYEPQEVEPDQAWSVPRPQLIVAVGTGLTIAAALLGG